MRALKQYYFFNNDRYLPFPVATKKFLKRLITREKKIVNSEIRYPSLVFSTFLQESIEVYSFAKNVIVRELYNFCFNYGFLKFFSTLALISIRERILVLKKNH